MQYSILDFLRSALSPVLCADVAAGASCDVHLRLIAIVAMRAFPNQLTRFVRNNLNFTVKAAFLTIVALGIEFRIHDIIIDKFHNGKHRRDIVLHVGNFHVADCTAGRKLLEFTFKLQLRKGVDFFRNVYVIAVRNVALIRNAGDDTETLL